MFFYKFTIFLATMYQTTFIGKNIEHFNQLDSTNRYALDLISKSNPIEGTVISTSFQTAGRGQIGRGWHSGQNENITLSVILKPDFLEIRNQYYLNMALAVSVRALIASKVDQKVCIKWPNDIYIEDSKIAGLLIQNVLMGSSFTAAVLGIGINVNQKIFPMDLPNPTSVFLASGLQVDLKSFSHELFARLEEQYIKLKKGFFKSIHLEYLEHLYLKNEGCHFKTRDEQSLQATIQSVDGLGKLVLKLENGSIQKFNFNELKYVLK